MIIRKEDALLYHASDRKGKIEILPTKPVASLRDLSLAYSPGVAFPCLEIAEDVSKVYDYTARGNLVAVITNGTAVLGLGNIGPEAAKPVMEGKSILFKKYADIDGIDIEINCTDVDEFCRVVKAMEPTFGGINLEDIKSPECFAIEERLRREMKIPVMHDDQHGTAIVSGAALLNALECAKKEVSTAQMLICGAGAAAIACAKMYVELGIRRENIVMVDIHGVININRTDLDASRKEFATTRVHIKNLSEAFTGMDIFVGLSAANLVTGEMLSRMSEHPIVFAMANPEPEISYEEAMAARPDAIMATGRSDYPNQVNNVLGFPYIFRGALDVRATQINEAMKLAAAKAIAAIAHQPVPDFIGQIYGSRKLNFGPEYLIPKPMDPRLLVDVALAVAEAACATGVATRPITDRLAYREELITRLGQGNTFLRSVTLKAQKAPQRIVFPEAYNYKVLKAAQALSDEKIAIPILLGSPERILKLLAEYEIELPNPQIIDPEADTQQLESFGNHYYERRARKGATPRESVRLVAQRNYYGMMMVREGMADALLTGQTRPYHQAVKPVLEIIGLEDGIHTACGLYIMRNKKDIFFFADTTINCDPSEDQLVDIGILVTRAVQTLGYTPRVAMLSYSNFGANRNAHSLKVAGASRRLKEKNPDIVLDGEIQANFALRPDLMQEFFPFSTLAKTGANTFIFPDLTSANISYKLLQEIGKVEAIGPVLLGVQQAVHVMQMGSSVREIVNLATLAALDAQSRK